MFEESDSMPNRLESIEPCPGKSRKVLDGLKKGLFRPKKDLFRVF
jgi:hypothetical protein